MSAKWYFLLYLTRCVLSTWLKFLTPSDLQKGDFGLRSWQTRGKGKESFILLVFWMLSLYFWPESVNLNTIIDIFKGILLFFVKNFLDIFQIFINFVVFFKTTVIRILLIILDYFEIWSTRIVEFHTGSQRWIVFVSVHCFGELLTREVWWPLMHVWYIFKYQL